MHDAAEIRRRIALYREHLAQGVEGPYARIYLAEIAKLETMLKAIEKK